MRLFLGDGTVLYSLGNDEQLTRTKGDVALVHTNGDATFENKEEIIRVVMRVPNELAFDLDDHEIVAVELPDDAGLPVTFKCSELLREIDSSHGVHGT